MGGGEADREGVVDEEKACFLSQGGVVACSKEPHLLIFCTVNKTSGGGGRERRRTGRELEKESQKNIAGDRKPRNWV